MIIKSVFQIIFYLAMLGMALYSILLIYILGRYGQSKPLVILVSVFFLILLTTLYGAAVYNFNQIPFHTFNLQIFP